MDSLADGGGRERDRRNYSAADAVDSFVGDRSNRWHDPC